MRKIHSLIINKNRFNVSSSPKEKKKRQLWEGKAITLYFGKDWIVNRIMPPGHSKNKLYIELKMPFRDCANGIIQIPPSKNRPQMLAFIIKVEWYVIYFPLLNSFLHFCSRIDLLTASLISLFSTHPFYRMMSDYI